MISCTCWKCHCGHEAQTSDKFAVHSRACSILHPAGWFDGWDGVSPPRASQTNNGPTPPGEVILGWRKPRAA